MGSLVQAFSVASAGSCQCNNPSCEEEIVMDIGMLAAEEEESEDEEMDEGERKFLWAWNPKEYRAMLNRVENRIRE
eukprot:9434621-Karenia_brevis.AAC.1